MILELGTFPEIHNIILKQFLCNFLTINLVSWSVKNSRYISKKISQVFLLIHQGLIYTGSFPVSHEDLESLVNSYRHVYHSFCISLLSAGAADPNAAAWFLRYMIVIVFFRCLWYYVSRYFTSIDIDYLILMSNTTYISVRQFTAIELAGFFLFIA